MIVRRFLSFAWRCVPNPLQTLLCIVFWYLVLGKTWRGMWEAKWWWAILTALTAPLPYAAIIAWIVVAPTDLMHQLAFFIGLVVAILLNAIAFWIAGFGASACGAYT